MQGKVGIPSRKKHGQGVWGEHPSKIHLWATCLFIIEVSLIYNIMSVSGIQQNDSIINNLCMYVCVCSVAQWYLTLCSPMDCSPPGSSVHGISQARILEWVPFPLPGDLPDPGIEPVSPVSPVLAYGFFTTEPPGKSVYISIFFFPILFYYSLL